MTMSCRSALAPFLLGAAFFLNLGGSAPRDSKNGAAAWAAQQQGNEGRIRVELVQRRSGFAMAID
jgi:hypothetical protein